MYVGPRPWRLRAAALRPLCAGYGEAHQGEGDAPEGRAETLSDMFNEQDAGDGTAARPPLGVVEFGGGTGSEIKEGQRLMAVAADVRRARRVETHLSARMFRAPAAGAQY